jgi:hypothetical protein
MHDIWSLALRIGLAAAVSLSGCSTRAADKPPAASAAAEPLALAHAHNDYLHDRPLLDALEHGFTSVEADIFLVDGKLLVAHSEKELKPSRTLQSLYLDPLRRRIAANGGSVYRGGGPFTLLIDIKSAGEPTYAALAKVLAEYADMFSVVRNGKLETKAVTAVVSGSRPRAMMEAEKVRYAGYDGRLSDLNSDAPADFMPLVSDNWLLNFKWKGTGPIPAADREKLRDVVAKAHAHGRRIRLWATPDTTDMWRELRAGGVDMINTDDLAGLEKFLRESSASN